MQKPPYSREQAVSDNARFDHAVENFLREWLILGSPDSAAHDQGMAIIHEHVKGGALRDYFKHNEKPYHKLLENRIIADHLCRTHRQVYFDPQTHEPLLSHLESRIYNLAAHRQQFQIPYRFIPPQRQGAHGDRASAEEMSGEQIEHKQDIGDFFATRRADPVVIDTMHRELHHAVRRAQFHVHMIDDHYLDDALRSVVAKTEAHAGHGKSSPEFFIIQYRYSPTDRHFGSALLVMNPAQPNHPKRIVFCDTVNLPGWLPAFGDAVKRVFGEKAEGIIEIGSHPLQGLNREPNVADHDINCSFYTRSMARALLMLAQEKPQLLLLGTVDQIQQAMKQRMQDYYRMDGTTKPREEIQNTNLYKRWNIGRSMMLRETGRLNQFAEETQSNWLQSAQRRAEDRSLGLGLDVVQK